LETLQGSLVLNDISIRITHGSPDSPELYQYILSGDDIREDFESFDEQICIVGHSHKPVIFRQEIKTKYCEEIFSNGVKIEEGYKYIINLGSVGQPRDKNSKACVYMYDNEKKMFLRTRHEYDISGAQQQIMATPLPVVLSERLEEGY
jgi:diadenosine tetraphosphatase ApaH/serine/threonine PP2A family protein phosphatase